jgi:lauroyl/myristoyl acyltransferase
MFRLALQTAYLLAVAGLIGLAGQLPAPGRAALAAGIGTAAYGLSAAKRGSILAALAEAFPEGISRATRQQVALQSFRAFWQEALAVPPGRAAACVTGLERVRAALDAGRGAILLESVAFGHRARAKQILHAHGLRLHAVHSDQHGWGFQGRRATRLAEWVMRRAFEQWESAYVAEIIYVPSSEALGYTRRLVDCLRRNEVVCLTGDGPMGQRTVTLELLGKPRPFATGVASLGRLSGASLLPLFCVEEPAGRYRLAVEPPLDVPAGAGRDQGPAETMGQYVRLLDSYIRRYPGQYRNWQSLQPNEPDMP